MDGDDSDRPRQHSYSISPARSLLPPLTIAIGGQKKEHGGPYAGGADGSIAADRRPGLRAICSDGCDQDMDRGIWGDEWQAPSAQNLFSRSSNLI